MGYACPVCDAPQRDETHLANHMALQAIVHSDAHETWLDEHAPDWDTMNADGLGPILAELAVEREFDEVFEDTVDRTHGHGHDHDHEQHQFGGQSGSQSLSGDAARVFEEARDLTREMYESEEGDTDESEAKEPADDADEKES
ncbi:MULTISPECIES: DUF5810 domain-containing protein [Haloferax]|uniref:Uncharacterized protein n=1 Tax=Haloferax marinum TaxID=2666143 RepID=A0A6A8G947_9EURY|nr:MULTISPECIES: DUF5810 domain-containing protein [Haloferax]KAB1198059.1 hypothetical protein Hfx1150_11215 [Haloferax sp. CBA1150]MRW97128.1 hypothetical protein [Haloferax marinum]